jgi:hypothetical protein
VRLTRALRALRLGPFRRRSGVRLFLLRRALKRLDVVVLYDTEGDGVEGRGVSDESEAEKHVAP